MRPALLGVAFAVASLHAQVPTARILAWNELGMHCMDSDFAVFSILPPYNNVEANLIVNGLLITSASPYTVHYEGVADPDGSINLTSIGKTNWWQHTQALFGATFPLDTGLAGFSMPGLANSPQSMHFQSNRNVYLAQGIPLTPIDEAGHKNPYPLFRITARDAAGNLVADTVTVVPVSQEMACTMCHGSGSNPAARPAVGWAYADVSTDERINILRLHDDRQGGTQLYTDALAWAGFAVQGLAATAAAGNSVLCAKCHGSNALGTPGFTGVTFLTAAMHNRHAEVRVPGGERISQIPDRVACYVCHPGNETKCLRGAMGQAIGADGHFSMSCQGCHGDMHAVADPARTGWLQEPNCQNCHTGDAVQNRGQLRFTSAFDAPGHLRAPSNLRFATTPDAPQAGFSLYRYSTGHGGLHCPACHGSPHAEYPTEVANDNVQSQRAQGHIGVIVECGTCHPTLGDSQINGPHGLHPLGDAWLGRHPDVVENGGGPSQCQPCHGADYRGTPLSAAHGARSLSTRYGQKNLWRGFQVGCYDCHNGPDSDDSNPNRAPVVADVNLATHADQSVPTTLTATDPDPGTTFTMHLVTQPAHGTVAFQNGIATYTAQLGFTGADIFTYAASDGSTWSNLGTVTVNVSSPACPGSSDSFGFGCPAEDGSQVHLRVDGCLTPGQHVDFVATDATGAFGLVVFGGARAAIELSPGCVVATANVIPIGPLPVIAGAFSVAVDLPSALGSVDLITQAFVLDASTGRGFTGSQGLAIHIRR
jgi:hypothetical protein